MVIQKVDPDEAKAIVSRVLAGKAYLIDVRDPDEWKAGHASAAIHFPVTKLEKGEMPDLPKDAEIYTCCTAGGRAETAKGILIDKGFLNVKNLGGLRDWKLAGGDVVT